MSGANMRRFIIQTRHSWTFLETNTYKSVLRLGYLRRWTVERTTGSIQNFMHHVVARTGSGIASMSMD